MKFTGQFGGKLEATVEFIPSIGWVCLMFIPLVFQYTEFHPTGRAVQLAIVGAIASLLFTADSLCYSRALRRGFQPALYRSSVGPWLVVIGLFFLLPLGLHLFLMPEIPLLIAMLDGEATNGYLMMLRENSAKLLDVPPLLKYLFNWTLSVFAPIFVVVAIFTGRRMLGAAGLLVASLYAAATYAKFPILFLIVTCFIASCVIPSRFRRALTLSLVACVLTFIVLVGVLLQSDAMNFVKTDPNQGQATTFSQMNEEDPRQVLSYGDVLRLRPAEVNQQYSKIQSLVEYLIYRSWLTPVDVSNRWYQYYTYVKSQPLGIERLLLIQNSAVTAPSREVGLWAYRARFPQKYGDTINAYASFDADAFAHGGISGVLLAMLLLLGARIGAAFLLTSHPVSLAGYGVLLCSLALLPSTASLQAIFGAHGLIFVLGGLVLVRVLAPEGAFVKGVGKSYVGQVTPS